MSGAATLASEVQLTEGEIIDLYDRARRLRRKIRAPGGLEVWCRSALAEFGEAPARHHLHLIRYLEDIADGTCDRLMVFMPPGHAKSTYVSHLFPPYFLARHPRSNIIGASHTAELAEFFSGKVQRYIVEHSSRLGYALAGEAKALWGTSKRGTYRAAGVGGVVTGFRSDLFLIDDPIKGRQEADSLLVRDKAWNWYRSEVVTRLKPGARVVLVLTRWHPDDLAGRLLEAAEEGGDQWRVINLPALAEDNDALGREPGEALWPEWEGIEALERKRMAVGPREWQALYQQSPRVPEGALFKVANVQTLDVAPNLRGATVGRGWDLAATKQVGTRDPDWTVGLKMARLPSGLFVVLDVFRGRGGPDEVDGWVNNVTRQDGHGCKASLPQDPGQAGKAQALAFTRLLSGFPVETSTETGDKATRAAPFASQVNGGNVAIVRAPWNAAFLDELASFPAGTKDDQVDAASRAFSIVGLGARALVTSDAVLAALGQR